MRVFIQTQGLILSRDEQEHIRQRLRQVLARFGERALGATLHLRDINGPRGGDDKDCHLVIEMEDTTAVVRDRGSQVRALVERALHRATHSISKQIGRIHDRPLRAPQLGKGRGQARNRREERALRDFAGAA
jgi:hypothetical protein